MIINENNKNNLKGMVKRGFNQDPLELRSKFNPIDIKTVAPSPIKTVTQENKLNTQNGNLKETYGKLRRLKWK